MMLPPSHVDVVTKGIRTTDRSASCGDVSITSVVGIETGVDADDIRFSLTLPGSASLGAFQAGAMSALAVAITTVRRDGRPVHVDAIGGSSAGSIVGMLFGHCLLNGRDTPLMLRSAWVDNVDMFMLRSHGSGAPLEMDRLRENLVDMIDDTEDHPCDVHDPLPSPVDLEVGLTSLLGFTVPVTAHAGEVSSLTYADWARFTLRPGGGRAEVVEAPGSSLLDAVLASAAHPLAFEPSLLDRQGDREVYEQRGIDNLPDTSALWFTDGGLVESRPVGRIVVAARRRAGQGSGRRVHLIVDPRSSGPSGDAMWADSSTTRTWLDGLRRAISVVPTQALHDDVRSVADVNRRLAALDDAVDQLADETDGGLNDERRSELRERFARVADLQGKEHVDIEMISPLPQTDQADGVTDLLAGDFIGAFGGFLERSIRRSDFALGWASTQSWIEQGGLARSGLGADEIAAVLHAVATHEFADEGDAVVEGDGIDQLDAGGRWRLALLAAHVAKVVVAKAVPSKPAFLERRSS